MEEARAMDGLIVSGLRANGALWTWTIARTVLVILWNVVRSMVIVSLSEGERWRLYDLMLAHLRRHF